MLQKLWKFVATLVEETKNAEVFTVQNIIFNTCHVKPNHIINFIVLMVKYCIFQQKCLGNQPSIGYIIMFYHELDVSKAKTKKRYEKVLKKWRPMLLDKLK